ncbi:MAG: hypothetical protein H7098_10125 [Oligoflexus sp.]|nr:hypothetical protein [Pseudopedobacter sp.]
MKKLSNITSPFLMMIIPVIMFIGLSITFKNTEIKADDQLTTTTTINKATSKIVKVGEQSIIRFLLNQ